MSASKVTSRFHFAPRPLFRFTWRYLFRHPWQTILMILGITLGVAVVVAIDLANASATRAFDLSTEMVTGRATHQILGGPGGIDEVIYADLRRHGLGAEAAPVVVEFVTSEDLGGRPLQLLGVDPFAEAPFRNYLSADGGPPPSGNQGFTSFLTTPASLFLSTDLAGRYLLETGDTLHLNVAGSEHEATIAGLLEPADDLSRRALEGILLVDIATAQELSGRLGRLDRIDVVLDQDDEASRALIESRLPAGLRLEEVAARAGSLKQITAGFRTNLVALSLLALVVGLFLIYNTMTFSVVQRRSLFGTVRALGITRGELFLMVIGEAFLVGIVGSVAGLVLGTVLGQGAIHLVSQTISDLYFVVTVRAAAVPAASLVKGGLLGLIATLLAAAPPAWEAASATPRAALVRSGLEDKASAIVARVALAGAVLLVVGLGILFLPTKNLVISFAGTFAIIVGAAMIAPRVTGLMMNRLAPATGRIWGVLGRLGPRNVVSSLSRTSVAIAALMIAVSVAVGVGLMISSFRNTVDVWLSESVQGDIYISPPTYAGSQTSGIIDPAVKNTLESWPGVLRVDTFRMVEVESADGPINLAYTQNPSIGLERVYKWVDRKPEEVWSTMLEGSILVSEPLANRMGITPQNDMLILETPEGKSSFPIVGVYYDYSSSQGIVLMAHPLFESIWGVDDVGAISLRMSEDIDVEQVASKLTDVLAPIQPLEVRPNAALRAEALAIFDRTFAITGAMQLLTTLVAFIGVLSALLSLQLDKKRELGILRAVGLTVRQLWKLVLYESGLLGASAGLLAMPTGLGLALILIYIINRRAFGWTLQLQLDATPFLEALIVALLAALAAGILPTWHLSKQAAADAMRSE